MHAARARSLLTLGLNQFLFAAIAKKWARSGVMLVAGLVLAGAARAATVGPFTIIYNPVTKLVQTVDGSDGGKYPSETFTLQITGGPTSSQLTNPGAVPLTFTVLSSPVADPSGFISATPLSYLGDGRTLVTNITVSVPEGTTPGGFGWRVKPSWPSNINIMSDNGAAINATVTGPPSAPAIPSVVITTPHEGDQFIITSGSSISIPIDFNASVTGNGKIDSLTAQIDSTPLNSLFVANGLSTASASGSLTYPNTVLGPRTITVTATNGSANASAVVHINIKAPPKITSANSATFPLGQASTFTVTTTGYPAPTLSLLSGTLPSGVTFNPATGLLSGTPATGTAGSYPLVFTAVNGTTPDAVQNFTLIVTTVSQVLTWNAPAGIVYGTPLTANGQLNAIVTLAGTPVSGTFVYSPAVGAIVKAGPAQPLSVTFTPDNPAYQTMTGTVNLAVAKKPLTITGAAANDRQYDRTTNATIFSEGTLVGKIAGDDVSIDVTGATAVFTTKDVGGAKPVVISGLSLAGQDAGNYTLTQPSVTAAISPAPLTVVDVAIVDKVYNGNTSATVANVGTLSGVFSGDTVTLGTGGVQAAFTSKNVGTGIAVNLSGYSISGTDAKNYTLTQPAATGKITKAPLTVPVTAANRPYNAGTAAMLTVGALSGVISPDVVTLNSTNAAGAFADKNVGTQKPVTVSGLVLEGADAGNYSVTASAPKADITAVALTVSGTTATNRVYDATTSVALNTTASALVGVLGTDVVTLGKASAAGSIADKKVGTAKSVTISGFTISGADAANYTLTQPSTTVNIATAALTITGTVVSNRAYNGTTGATITTNGALAGVLGTDAVTLGATGVTATFADKNVGTAKNVTVTGFTISGADASNYTLTQPAPKADISALALTLTGATAVTRVYNATTAATLSSFGTLQGVVSPDVVTLVTAGATGAFADENVGTGKTVTISGLTLGGSGAGNYTLTAPTATGTITKAPLNVTATYNKVYDTTTKATLTASNTTISTAAPTVFAGDVVTLNFTNVAANFPTANAATTAKTITVTGLALSGADAGNYEIKTITASGIISKATPVIEWAKPAAIVSGTKLTATQLNAIARPPGSSTGVVAGTYSYNPALNIVLPVGVDQILNVTFTPTDTTNYNSATGTQKITVTGGTTNLAVCLLQPFNGNNGGVVTHAEGAPAVSLAFSFAATASGGSITALSAKLQGPYTGTTPSGTIVNPTVTAQNLLTLYALGSGTLSLSQAGNYTLTVTATGAGGVTKTDSLTFTVKEPKTATSVCWQGELATDDYLKASKATTLEFKVKRCILTDSGSCSNHDDDDDDDDHHYYGSDDDDDDDDHHSGDCDDDDDDNDGYSRHVCSSSTCSYVKDTTVVITISEVNSNCTETTVKTYTYSGSSKYTIDSNNLYSFSFTPGSGKRTYHVEVDYFPSGSTTPKLAGETTFKSK